MSGTVVILALVVAITTVVFGLVGYVLRIVWERRAERDIYRAQGAQEDDS